MPTKRPRTHGPQVVDPLAGTPAPVAPTPAGAAPVPDSDATRPADEPILPIPPPVPTPPVPTPIDPSPLNPPGADPTLHVAATLRAGPPVPESQLSPDQRRIRVLEDQLARERGVRDPEPELVVPAQIGARDNIVIHFLEDGFTALGKVWYRGQELEFEPGGSAYADTCDRHGRSWLELRGDDFAQVERWGKIMFRPGPWPGKKLTDPDAVRFEAMKPVGGGEGGLALPSPDELAAAEKAELARRRAAPRLPVS